MIETSTTAGEQVIRDGVTAKSSTSANGLNVDGIDGSNLKKHVSASAKKYTPNSVFESVENAHSPDEELKTKDTNFETVATSRRLLPRLRQDDFELSAKARTSIKFACGDADCVPISCLLKPV